MVLWLMSFSKRMVRYNRARGLRDWVICLSVSATISFNDLLIFEPRKLSYCKSWLGDDVNETFYPSSVIIL